MFIRTNETELIHCSMLGAEDAEKRRGERERRKIKGKGTSSSNRYNEHESVVSLTDFYATTIPRQMPSGRAECIHPHADRSLEPLRAGWTLTM